MEVSLWIFVRWKSFKTIYLHLGQMQAMNLKNYFSSATVSTNFVEFSALGLSNWLLLQVLCFLCNRNLGIRFRKKWVHDNAVISFRYESFPCSHVTLRSGVADYVIFLIMTWSSSDYHILTIMTKISVEHEFLFRILEPATQDPTVMEWPCPFPLCWVHRLALSNSLILVPYPTWSEGLDHSMCGWWKLSKVAMVFPIQAECHQVNKNPTCQHKLVDTV
jgi:hypothetical protein